MVAKRLIELNPLRNLRSQGMPGQEAPTNSIAFILMMRTLGMSYVLSNEEVAWQCIRVFRACLISSGPEGYGG